MRILLCFLVVLTACHSARTFTSRYELKFIGFDTIPYNFQFKNTSVGGLSGIDYDAATNSYYLICDDRSSISPARFYRFSIPVSLRAIGPISVDEVRFLLREDGTQFPNAGTEPENSVDPEALRMNTATRQLVWTSEGERLFKNNRWILVPPSVKIMDTSGHHLKTFPVDSSINFYAEEFGLRRNGVFEGMTFIKKNKELLVSIEEPLYQDGPQAGLGDTTGLLRVLRFDVSNRKLVGQYFYACDPVSKPPVKKGDYVINGISDILAFDDNKIWIMERSYSTGIENCDVKIYQVRLDELPRPSENGKPENFPKPFRKELILDLNSLGIRIDNLEGMSFGPKLENGSKSLLLVSDNNFAPSQISQVLLFELKKR